MTYLDLLPIGRRINYRGLTYTVRAVWCKGVVCRTDNGESKILEGEKKLDEVKPYPNYIFATGKKDAIPFVEGARRFMVSV